MKPVKPKNLLLLLLVFFSTCWINELFAQKLAALPYVDGFNMPIDLKHCGDDRLFVAERTGVIRIINADNSLNPVPFLDISTEISSTNSEEGFLGFAFSPDYKTSGKFYVNYTSNIAGQLTSVIKEFKVSADTNAADPASALVIITQAQPFSNHNGGNMLFGDDGYLYINFGDGGSGGDPYNNAQDLTTFLGKILRIDISQSSIAAPYTIPPSNPFYSDVTPGIKKEIWAYGLRNPWRSSIDKLTGDFWIADVGQGQVEEIDFEPKSASGGRNYGWKIMEGNTCYNSPSCNTTGLTLPLYSYTHDYGHSITGGFVYRSPQSKSLFGMYIFADYVLKWIDGIRQSNGILEGSVQHLITNSQATGNPVSFGEDRWGGLYIMFNNNNTVYRLEDTSYLRKPKAYFTATGQGGGSFLFNGLQGKNLMYQWLKDGVEILGATQPDYIASQEGSYTLKVTNSLGNSDISEPFILGIVPVRILSFTAQESHLGINLKWKTASEENSKGFAVQRKWNNEGVFKNISFIATKAANGNSSGGLSYLYTDTIARKSGQVFYRIKMENIDGSYSLSGIQAIRFSNSGIHIFPNPSKGEIHILLDDYTSHVLVSLYNNLGKKVGQYTIKQKQSVINLSAKKGIYYMQFKDMATGKTVRKKVLVE